MENGKLKIENGKWKTKSTDQPGIAGKASVAMATCPAVPILAQVLHGPNLTSAITALLGTLVGKVLSPPAGP
jgi:hypothetical protein